MVALTQQERQVIELFRKLDPSRRRVVLLELAQADPDAWKQSQPQGESRLRDLASQRGLEWDRMTDDERQDFVESHLAHNSHVRLPQRGN